MITELHDETEWVKNFPGRRNNKCTVPEVRVCLEYLMNSKEARGSGVDSMRTRIAEYQVCEGARKKTM